MKMVNKGLVMLMLATIGGVFVNINELVLKSIALGLSIASVVPVAMKFASTEVAAILLGIGLFCLSIASLQG